MLQKLFYIDDIFRYIAEYLNFNQKLVLQKIFKKCLTKNCDFFSDSYKLRNMAGLCSICSSCHGDISYDVKSILSSNYDNFLYGENDSRSDSDSGNESDSESEDYKLIFSGNRREYYNNYDVEENLFVYLSFPYVANRAFFEVLEKNEIKLECEINDILCIFELELKDEIYEEIYTTVDDIYINGIVNGCID